MEDPIRQSATALLQWYRAGRRELPWRRTRDPYRIWVSEVMLQQTRVDTVIPYYERWLRRFPDLDTLAAAGEDEVLKLWEGLGYYRRARNLHRGARLLRERHGGTIPADPRRLRAVPGVGEYTAGAIASIAFGARAAAIDGNARRVLSRVFDIERPTAARLRRAADAWLPATGTGDFNQAVMELGARVCSPAAPRCDACPIAAHCLARARGTQELRPGRAAPRAVPHVAVACAVLVDPDGRILLVRRPDEGLLAGLWELPGAETTARGTAAVARALARRWSGREPPRARRLQPVPHVFSHRRITYHPFVYRLGWAGAASGGAWASAEERQRLALPVAQRKILALL